jgi:hypothetical protein
MISGIDYRILTPNLIEIVVNFYDGKTVSMCLTKDDIQRMSFFINCLSMELEAGGENEHR